MFRHFTSILALLLVLLAAPAGAANERKDFQIFKDVSSTVLQYSRFTIFDDVSASVEGGVVTLHGKVTMPFKKTEIEKRVAKVDGVARVENRIGVLGVSTFDDELRYVIARAIYGNSAFWHYAAMSNPPIHIVVDRGHVTLKGVVNNEVERAIARSLATTFGALSVKSELRTDAEAQAELERIGL